MRYCGEGVRAGTYAQMADAKEGITGVLSGVDNIICLILK